MLSFYDFGSYIRRGMSNERENKAPRILLWDIENLPMLVASWGLYNQNHSPDSIIQDKSIICISYKYLGEKDIYTISIGEKPRLFNKSPYNDYHVVKAVYDVLKDVDILVAHNGDAFDLKCLNARALYHNLPPLPHIPSVDTLKAARKHFRFSSNKLGYLAKHLGVGRKGDVNFGDWLGIIGGDWGALERMEKYNRQDVAVLEDVYLKLRPYISNHPNLNLYEEDGNCPNCGHNQLIKNGYRYTRTGKFQRYQCGSCGAESRGKHALQAVDIR